MVLLMAGHDATGAMLGGIIEWLSHDKDLFDRLRNRPEDFPRAFEEFMRFIPAGLAGTRTRIAYDDVQIGDVLIKKGDSVLPIVHAANFDPAVFPDPMSFDLEREPSIPHVGFGHGAHACVGQQLARMQIDVAIKAILRRYSSLTNTNTDPDWASGRLLRGPKKLQVSYSKAEAGS
jgi:nocardicin N-oxygenase